jgi:hypothetical protein
LGIKPVEPVVGSYPELVFMVPGYGNDLVIAEAVVIFRIMQEIYKTVILPDIFIQSPVCSDPEVTVSIFIKDGIVKIAGDRVSVTGDGSRSETVRLVCMEGFQERIKPVKPVPLVEYPDLVEMILVKIRYPVLGRGFVRFSGMIHLVCVAVISVEPVLGTEPEKTKIIFNKGRHQTVGEPVLESQFVKTDVRILGTDSQ